MICNVCGQREAEGVFASRIAPVSMAYCEECIRRWAEPYSLLVTRVAFLMTRIPEFKLSTKLQVVKASTLEITGITEEQFEKDILKRKQEILEKQSKNK